MMNKEEIIDIFDRYISRKATGQEIEELRDFIRSDREFSAWLENQISESPSEMDEETEERMLAVVRSEINRKKNRTLYLKVLKWAAMIAVPVALCTSLYFNLSTQPEVPFVVSADKGDKANVVLPDGSKLDINSSTKLTYYSDYNKKDRNVTLDGEAYFDVRHDTSKPFTVRCDDISITVLGTTFGIKDYSYDRYISVVLKTGKISLRTPTETIIMHPNERVVYNKVTKTAEAYEVDASEYVNWMHNRLRFDNETLGNIAKVISNTHNVDIVFADNNLKNMRFTGTLSNKSIDTVLNMIVQTSPVRYRYKNGQVILYNK
jgi:transmembrane sensor